MKWNKQLCKVSIAKQEDRPMNHNRPKKQQKTSLNEIEKYQTFA